MFGFLWWLTRPSQTDREGRLRDGLCPRCGSPRTVPVLYGRVVDLNRVRSAHPEGFFLAGCHVKSFDDPGPDRYCERRCYRFYGYKRPST